MKYATRIRMKPGCGSSNDLTEIDEIFIDGDGVYQFYKKEYVHDLVKANPCSIKVSLAPYPYVVHAISSRGEKYVRSEPNDRTSDNLLRLPRV